MQQQADIVSPQCAKPPFAISRITTLIYLSLNITPFSFLKKVLFALLNGKSLTKVAIALSAKLCKIAIKPWSCSCYCCCCYCCCCCCWLCSLKVICWCHTLFSLFRSLSSITSRTLPGCHGRQKSMLWRSSSVMTRPRHSPVNQVKCFFFFPFRQKKSKLLFF